MTAPALAHRTAAFWNDVYATPGASFEPIPLDEIRFLQDRAGAKLGQRAMDIGTGLGEWACQMTQVGLLVTGYDHSSVAIERARELHGAHGGMLRFELHDFDNDPIPPNLGTGNIDLISCRHSLHFLDQQRFIVDAKRWLHPDGVMHVTTAVTEKIHREIGMPEERVRALAQGWREYDRYDLAPDGSITAVVLRGPWG
ncbi:class I SAM-dependent methyltransferase [Streptomyces diastatochromogenes]|nr:class I SAM-dependent methyltransferase [Streptomyces diastatochromogenes]